MTLPTQREKDLIGKAIVAFVRFILFLREENDSIEDEHILDVAAETLIELGGKIMFSRKDTESTAMGLALWAAATAEYLIMKKRNVS